MHKNGRMNEIKQLLNSAKPSIPARKYKQHGKLIPLLAAAFCLGYMAQTTYTLYQLSNEVKTTNLMATKLRSDITQAHALHFKTQSNQGVIL